MEPWSNTHLFLAFLGGEGLLIAASEPHHLPVVLTTPEGSPPSRRWQAPPVFQGYLTSRHTQPCLATMPPLVYYTGSPIFVSSKLKAKCKRLVKVPSKCSLTMKIK